MKNRPSSSSPFIKRPVKYPVKYPVKRREVLGFISGAAVVSLLGCQRQSAAEPAETSTSAVTTPSSAAASSAQTVAETNQAMPTCIVSPEQTEGPYFVEEALNRSDIREGKAGVPLRLILRVSQVSPGACIPLENALIDIWHCDAEGIYSDVTDRRFNTVGQKFLRGSQITSPEGTAEFITIYPGWYQGRTTHIHFKIRNSNNSQNYEFTSQLYFDDAMSDRIYTQAPYSDKGARDQKNQSDRIYQNGGQQLTLQLTEADEGYTSTFDIGLQIA